ncbi:hypothetical protein [Gymnodinialimonas sp.]
MSETAQLIVTRAGGYADYLRAYRILVDDIEMGRIKRNSELHLTIPIGQHVIGARIDWTRAQPIVIEARADETVRVEVFNTHGAMRSDYAITAGRNSYLTLRLV